MYDGMASGVLRPPEIFTVDILMKLCLEHGLVRPRPPSVVVFFSTLSLYPTLLVGCFTQSLQVNFYFLLRRVNDSHIACALETQESFAMMLMKDLATFNVVGDNRHGPYYTPWTCMQRAFVPSSVLCSLRFTAGYTALSCSCWRKWTDKTMQPRASVYS